MSWAPLGSSESEEERVVEEERESEEELGVRGGRCAKTTRATGASDASGLLK